MNIQEVFGQFAVELADGPVLFATKEEAAIALADYENGAESLRLAKSYTDAKELDGKNAKGKINVIVDFLNWVATQSEESSDEDEVAVATTQDGEGTAVTF